VYVMANLMVGNLGIYYGYPSLVNGSNGDVAKAAAAFKPFDVIVFGDSIEHSTHSDHAKTQQIISLLKPNGNKIFGYVPIGTNGAARLTIAQIKQNVDEWQAMGVYGIFLDEYGFDYGVTRSKQNDIVGYIHGKGLKAFANSWVPADAMGDKNEVGNNQPPLLGTGDLYLMESWIVEGGSIQSTSQWVTKADQALSYQQTKGVQIAVLPTTTNPASSVNSFSYKLVSYATAMYGFAYFQWTDDNYSASNNVINTSTLPQNYGTSFVDNSVSHTSDYKTLTRRTDTGTFTIQPSSNIATFTASSTPPPPPPPTGDCQQQLDALTAENANLKAQIASLQSDKTNLTNQYNSIKAIYNDFVTKMNNVIK
jgi:hypothetical protein